MSHRWGPNGHAVYSRTYSRRKSDGSKESWDDTVSRVVHGNLALVPEEHHLPNEAEDLTEHFTNFKMTPGGRHLWVTGVPGRHYLANCHRAGWGEHLSDHFSFVFSELMKGAGIGSNVSGSYLRSLPAPAGRVEMHVRSAHGHPDWDEFAPLLSPPSLGAAVEMRVDDSRQGWVSALSLILDTAEHGGGEVVIDVSDIRPRGSLIRGFGGTASGPLPLIVMLQEVVGIINSCVGHPLSSLDAMDLDHAIASCVVAGNVRRSARMTVKHWRDDDIVDFIQCKADTSKHWSTNISVEIDREFFAAYKAGSAQAHIVFDAVVAGMLENGEPGFFNSSAASEGETGDVRCTNPCGELALEEWENCVIGSLNLGVLGMDLLAATDAATLMARFLLRATTADAEDPRQREVVARNRRIGLGLYGVQEWAAAQKCKYSDIPHSVTLAARLQVIADAARSAADQYAEELGIPSPIKVTSIQPTGTTSQLSGHTPGCHPVYAKFFIRRIRYSNDDPLIDEHLAAGRHVEPCRYTPNTSVVSIPTKDRILDDYDEDLIESTEEISPATMLAVQAFLQRHFADNCVSYTVNLPEGFSNSELRTALLRYLPELRGTTVMVDGSRPQAPFERITREQYEAAVGTTVGQAIEDCPSGACPVR